MAGAIASADASALLSAIRSHGHATLQAPEVGEVAIEASDLVVTETPREGWAVAADAGESIALDLAITADLRRAGVAREVIRAVQEARKRAGYQVSDRINLWWSAEDHEVAQGLQEHSERIAQEVLAITSTQVSTAGNPNTPQAIEVDVEDLELRAWIQRA